MYSLRRIEIDTISPLVTSASYAVRGSIVTRSLELKAMLANPTNQLPFKSIISCNIGNPHSLQQKPVSFIRDVVSAVVNPSLIDRASFPKDVVERAQAYLKATNGSGMGAYSESQGILRVREEVASFLKERDGYDADPAAIFLTNGASEGVRLFMQTILRNPAAGFKDGVLTPIPQYPLYSALTTLLQGNLIPYHLDEDKDWACTVDSLRAALRIAEDKGIATRALVVINPGNPTGQVLTEEDMRSIVAFCVEEGICLMADEVYQENIWNKDKRFVSFRKVALDCGAVERGLQLISFHSISKGFLGECGLRGGYFELMGFSADVRAQVYKLASISLCSNTVGQVAVGCMVQPPQPGDESYETYASEKAAILSSLQCRADKLSRALDSMPGMKCNRIEGALYAFPSIMLPPKAVAEAREKKWAPDAYYCSELLESTGIVVVAGSGFRQVDGTFHFRTTILPPEDQLDEVILKLRAFHEEFIKKYSE